MSYVIFNIIIRKKISTMQKLDSKYDTWLSLQLYKYEKRESSQCNMKNSTTIKDNLYFTQLLEKFILTIQVI